MEAGRELDALIAEKVFGITSIEYQRCPTCGYDGLWVGDGYQPYSTDIACAWQVVTRLQSANPYWYNDPEESWVSFQLSPTIGLENRLGWMCNFGDDRTLVYAKTEALAICLAALKALGVEV
jgi:hypothetical protein